MADGRHLGKIEKSSYHRNGLTDCHEILYVDAVWTSLPFWPLSKFSKCKMAEAAILKNQNIASLSDCHRPTLSILPNKTANIIKQNWNQFLVVVKATVLKQQISKFYPQILSTEASFYIYDRLLTDINVIASVYALNCCFIIFNNKKCICIVQNKKCSDALFALPCGPRRFGSVICDLHISFLLFGLAAS